MSKQQLEYYLALRRDGVPARKAYELASSSWFVSRPDFYRRVRLFF